MPHPLLANLTAAQREAVTHVDGPLLIIAGPGSGKTRVVTHRVAYLLQEGVPASQVLAMTFTNKAADEMKARLETLAPGKRVWASTFHKFCARLLRMNARMLGLDENYTIYDTDDSLRVIRRLLKEHGEDSGYTSPEQVARQISNAKNRMEGPHHYRPRYGDATAAVVQRLYPKYQEALLAANAADFDDLLLHVANMLHKNEDLRAQLDARYRYILVDEYQDTNLAQYLIVRALSNDYPNLAVTGDPDQSIYGWRGANLKNILEFEKDYPDVKVVRLEQNYRSTQRICRVADALIANNFRRKKKTLFTENAAGAPPRLVRYCDQRDEADTIAGEIAAQIHAGRRRPRDFAVFYRINALSRTMENGLRMMGVPYQVVSGVEFWKRKEIKDTLAYVQLVNNDKDDNALLRVINTPPRGIGAKTVERIAAHARRERKTLLAACREAGMIQGLSNRAAVSVAKFVSLFDKLREHAAGPVKPLLRRIVEASGLRAALTKDESPEGQDRLANVEELITSAGEFDAQHPEDGGLEAFLEETALVNDVDDWEEETDKVTLMTLHAAKGLEFPCVYIIAIEQGIFPVQRSQDRDEDIEEERRLLFVGITRAEEELTLCHARLRDFRGSRRVAVASPFLLELPREEMERIGMGETPGDGYAIDYEADFTEPPPGPPGQSPTRQRDRDGNPTRRRGTAAFPLTVKTAAELLSEKGGPSADPPELTTFTVGGRVKHPEYGVGEVLALTGIGPKRLARVRFDGGVEKKFILSHSALRPV